MVGTKTYLTATSFRLFTLYVYLSSSLLTLKSFTVAALAIHVEELELDVGGIDDVSR